MSATNKAQKIAILYSGGQSLGGIEKYLIHLFKNIDEDIFDLTLISLGEWQLTDRISVLGHKVKIINGQRIRLKTIFEVGDYCKKNQIKLLVSQGTVANAYARLVSKKYNIRNLVTVHSDPSSEYSNCFIQIAYRIIDRILKKYTFRYIAVSKYIKNMLKKSGVDNSHIKVVYNGTDYPKAHSRYHKRMVIGSLGRLEYVKGYDILISAFAKLDNQRLRLRIAGEGGELEGLKKQASDLGVLPRVEFVGYKADEFKFLDAIDVYVQPSRCEGFGLALVEAMSQNIPVVVTPAGAMTEIVSDGNTGYIADDIGHEALAKAILKAISDIDSSTKVGENAGKFVNENFSTKKWIEGTQRAYEDAIK